MNCNLQPIRSGGNENHVREGSAELDRPYRVYMKLAAHVFFKEGKKAEPCFYGVRSVRIPGILKNKTKPSVQENLFSP